MHPALTILLRTLLYAVLTVVALVLLVVIGLQIPAIQTRLVRELTERVSAKLQFPVSIDRVSIKWLDRAVLEGVTVLDQSRQPMINVGRLEVDYDLKNLLDTAAHTIQLDEVLLYQPRVVLATDPKTGVLNFDAFVARIDKLLSSDTTRPAIPNQNTPFIIGKASVFDGTFSYFDRQQKPFNNAKLFDYYNFTLANVNGNLENFLILGDTVALDVQGLSARDQHSGLAMRQLDSRFLYCNKKMEFANLTARVGGSVLRDAVTLSYDHARDLGDFNHRVRISARLADSRIRAQELGYFSDVLQPITDTYLITGNFRGTVDDFRLTNTDLRFGPDARNRLTGDMAFRGLPNTSQTTVDFAFKPSVVNLADVRPYYSDLAFNAIAHKLGTVAFGATFRGRFDDFITAGNFRTALGNVNGKLALTLGKKPADPMRYDADFTADNFDLATLISQPDLLGKLTGTGRIAGRGLSLATAVADVDARLERFDFQGYSYRNVTVLGNLQQAFFNGQASLRDPHIGLDIDGEADFRAGQPHRFDLRGAVRKADLRALGLLTDSLTVSTVFAVQMTGNTLDQLIGTANFHDAAVTLNRQKLAIDSLAIRSVIEGDRRILDVDADFLTAELRGNFTPARATRDLMQLAREYQLAFAGTQAERNTYYAKKTTELNRQNVQTGRRVVTPALSQTGIYAAASADRYAIDYKIVTRTIQPLLNLFDTAVYIAPGTQLTGQFAQDNTALLTALLLTDSLQYGKNQFGKTTLDLTSSKFTTDETVLASLNLTSARQRFRGLLPTEQMQIEATWEGDHLDFTSSVKQTGSTNRANLNGALAFKGDALELNFQTSEFQVLDNKWTINPQGLIRKVGREYMIRNMFVNNQNQWIAVSGKLSDDPDETLTVEARNFQLATLSPLLSTTLGGMLNGIATIRDSYKTPIVESNLNVDELTYDDFLVGDIRSTGTFDPATQRVNVDAHIIRQDQDVLTLTGTYAPQQTQNALSLSAVFADTDLRIVQPFATDLVSGLGGQANGTVRIGGTLRHPILDGEVDIRKGKFVIDYLKAPATFEDKIYFGEDEIVARHITLRDPQGNTAIVRGGVYHDGFRNFNLRFDALLKNFQILNTTTKDNDLFYGAAIVTGRAELEGPISNIVIRADVTSNRGTKIYIPLDGATNVSTSNDYIRFVNHSAQTTQTAAPGEDRTTGGKADGQHNTTVDISGIRMDFNLNITPDAYCEIQLDRQTGDIIKAYGAGLLAMRIDTKGDFSMTGNYEIQQGEYTFTFENVINKRFKIMPNSRITWTGDPYGALMDVTAAYTQYTPLAPLLQNPNGGSTSETNPDRNRRYPVDLILKLNGDLAAPSVSYNLNIKERPATSEFRQAVQAFEARLQSSEQELNRQVSSVLLFNQLLPEGSGLFQQDQVSSGLYNSVSELLSNQISRLASNLNQNLDVGVSLGGFTANNANENLINNLQLRFSYRFLNDRFRISRDGGFTYGTNQTSAASLLGEWTLEYWITSDGRLRAKMYNRNQQSALAQTAGISTLTTGGGVSLLYTRTFNQLFGPRRTTLPTEPRNAPGIAPMPAPADATVPAVGGSTNTAER
jgi:hypothetical protein